MSDLVGNPEDKFSPKAAHGTRHVEQKMPRVTICIKQRHVSAEEIRCVFDDNLVIIFVKSS